MDRVIDINVRGVFVATQAALKHMNDGGRIIMGMLMRSPRWWRSSPVRSPRTLRARISPSMAERMP